ncbi:MAG: hypothetical protein ACRDP6_47000 [Actinoallomurus sp.]
MNKAERIAARQAEDEQARRAMEDRVLAHAARLLADDHSPEAELSREAAAGIAEHREMAAKRRVWAATDALGITPAVVPSEQELADAAMTRQQWYEAYATLLELCDKLQARDAALAIYAATRTRSARDMSGAAEALSQGTDHLQDWA